MKTIEFKILTPEGKTKLIRITEVTYWEAEIEAKKQGKILEEELIKTQTV
jgi:hypothetical protein